MDGRKLKKTLDRFYREYDFSARVSHDPIEIPRRYRRPQDQEVTGFLASSFAYGKIGLFKPILEKIVSMMGQSPYDFIASLKVNNARRRFAGIKYRFNTSDDVLCLLYSLHKVIVEYASLENAFRAQYVDSDDNTGEGLSGLMRAFLANDTTAVYGRDIRPGGYLQFFPSPASGSACKRANLFLRWMIRDRDIDLGVWKGIPLRKLIIPLDIHIGRISRCLGLTSRTSQNWKTAVEITSSLRTLDPDDPLKYDFALCHHGVSGLCRGELSEHCRGCILRSRSRN